MTMAATFPAAHLICAISRRSLLTSSRQASAFVNRSSIRLGLPAILPVGSGEERGPRGSHRRIAVLMTSTLRSPNKPKRYFSTYVEPMGYRGRTFMVEPRSVQSFAATAFRGLSHVLPIVLTTAENRKPK